MGTPKKPQKPAVAPMVLGHSSPKHGNPHHSQRCEDNSWNCEGKSFGNDFSPWLRSVWSQRGEVEGVAQRLVSMIKRLLKVLQLIRPPEQTQCANTLFFQPQRSFSLNAKVFFERGFSQYPTALPHLFSPLTSFFTFLPCFSKPQATVSYSCRLWRHVKAAATQPLAIGLALKGVIHLALLTSFLNKSETEVGHSEDTLGRGHYWEGQASQFCGFLANRSALSLGDGHIKPWLYNGWEELGEKKAINLDDSTV